jgi:chemotaxis-related protein WspB
MLFVEFMAGTDRFAVDARRVVEVLPLVHWKTVSDPPPGIVGMINYRRAPVAVLDLALLMYGRPSEQRMNTRIILVLTNVAPSEDDGPELQSGVLSDEGHGMILGLVAERVMGAVRRDPQAFVPPAGIVTTVPYLGSVLTDEPGIVQLVEVDFLLPEVRLAELTRNASVP